MATDEVTDMINEHFVDTLQVGHLGGDNLKRWQFCRDIMHSMKRGISIKDWCFEVRMRADGIDQLWLVRAVTTTHSLNVPDEMLGDLRGRSRAAQEAWHRAWDSSRETLSKTVRV